MRHTTRYILAALLAICAFSPFAAHAMDLDPKAISIVPPDHIPWGPVTKFGAQQAILAGDPAKPGPYVVMVKWLAGNMSHPHFHDGARYIWVISGTWWVGTGDTWDPSAANPVPAGSFVTHAANQVHWDGARDSDAVIMIMGTGPDIVTASPTAH